MCLNSFVLWQHYFITIGQYARLFNKQLVSYASVFMENAYI
jgi:hypothetical protein